MWPVDVRVILVLSAAGCQLGCETIQIQSVLFRKPIHLLIVDTLVTLPGDNRGHILRESTLCNCTSGERSAFFRKEFISALPRFLVFYTTLV